MVLVARVRVVVLALVAACGGAPAGAPRDPWAAARREADARLAQLHASAGMPGVTAAVVAGDAVVWDAARGTTAAGTALPLASVSKIATALLLARAVAAGRVDLDAPVARYVPAWRDAGAPITVRQLAGHLAGIRHYALADVARRGTYASLAAAAVAIVGGDPRVGAPGERYVYSSWGYTLLGAVLEGALGRPFAALLADDLAPHAGCALAIDRDAGPRAPAGGLVGTAACVARTARLVLPAARYVPPAIARALVDAQRARDGTPTGVGLGWRVGTDATGRRIAHHAGNLATARTAVVVYLDDDVVVALLANRGGSPPDVERAAQDLAAPFLAARHPR